MEATMLTAFNSNCPSVNLEELLRVGVACPSLDLTILGILGGSRGAVVHMAKTPLKQTC